MPPLARLFSEANQLLSANGLPVCERVEPVDDGDTMNPTVFGVGQRGYVIKCLAPNRLKHRGLNEQTNGLIREYFPKGMPLGNLSKTRVVDVMQALNTRPRKTLNYLTPNEIFYENVALGV